MRKSKLMIGNAYLKHKSPNFVTSLPWKINTKSSAVFVSDLFGDQSAPPQQMARWPQLLHLPPLLGAAARQCPRRSLQSTLHHRACVRVRAPPCARRQALNAPRSSRLAQCETGAHLLAQVRFLFALPCYRGIFRDTLTFVVLITNSGSQLQFAFDSFHAQDGAAPHQHAARYSPSLL